MRKQLKTHFVAVSAAAGLGAVLIASAVGLSNGAQPPRTDAADQSEQVTVAVTTRFSTTVIPIAVRSGDQFTLTLPSNPSTGFSWQMLNQPDSKVLKKVGSKYNEPEKPMPGRPVTETWTFKSVGKGKQSIEMAYLRPWEKGVTPARRQVFEVTVL